MKKTIALMLAMLFAVCAFATTAFADETTTEAAATTTTTTQSSADDDVTDGFDDTTTTTEADTTKADESTTTTTATADTTKADDTTTTTAADVTVTLAEGETAYEGQGDEDSNTTTKKPAAVDTTIPSTGSGIVVPAIALAVLAAGTVAVIKTKKED